MCGIIVVCCVKKNRSDHRALEGDARVQLPRLRPRGPDEESLLQYHETRVVLGICRLVVRNGAAAAQPLHGEHGCELVINGEVYDDPDDCAAVLTQWERVSAAGGDPVEAAHATLGSLSGEFAFALYDPRAGGLMLLARDALGVKPLFLGTRSRDGSIWAASTLTVLPDDIDDAIELLPGHFMLVTLEDIAASGLVHASNTDKGSVVTTSHLVERLVQRRWYTPAWSARIYETLGGAPNTSSNNGFTFVTARGAAEAILYTLDRAVRRRLLADSPVGVLLSGGLDSSVICALAAAARPDQTLHAYTVCLDDDGHRDAGGASVAQGDLHFARKVAAAYPNVVLHEVVVTRAEAVTALREAVRAAETDDVPTVRAAVPLLLLARAVRKGSQGVKAVLVGEGADELLAGYRRFSAMNDDALHAERIRLVYGIFGTELLRVDRATASSALEARVPFLDPEVVETCFSIAPALFSHRGGVAIEKRLLRLAAEKLRLPKSVLWRGKVQFADGGNDNGAGWVSILREHAERNGETEHGLYKRICREELPFEVKQRVVTRRHKDRRETRITLGLSAITSDVTVMKEPTWVWADSDLQGMVSLRGAKEMLKLLGVTPPSETGITVTWVDSLLLRWHAVIPFNNFTLLAGPPRPPSVAEIRADCETLVGGPCAVVNTYVASLLNTLGAPCYLIGCDIGNAEGCHVAIVVLIEGVQHFVDVGNAKPYAAVPLDDSHGRLMTDGITSYRLISTGKGCFAMQHCIQAGCDWRTALVMSDEPRSYASFQPMIRLSRGDQNSGLNPFKHALRACRIDSRGRKVALRDCTLQLGEQHFHLPTEVALRRALHVHFPRLLPLVTPALQQLRDNGTVLFRTGAQLGDGAPVIA